ncbi:DUF2065 domain-containing protein [Aurantimonas sp. VKM B-3413]|uniref:DUF2065 domain-containing protein n=1 Tax=Aurantimonas sp. VKM B-3413 TaxID=2779401 RepID=UPI001E2EFF05|nr:DUF2065 domain-containing protein [Aurantimonas sp. VKM B-3413]
MKDFLDALGLLLVIEGIFYCLFPEAVRRMAKRAVQLPESNMRIGGLVAVCLGVCVVWLVRR